MLRLFRLYSWSPVNMHTYLDSTEHSHPQASLKKEKVTHSFFQSVPRSLQWSRSVAKVTVEHRKERSEIMFSFPGAGR